MTDEKEINEYGGDVESFTVIDDFESGTYALDPEGASGTAEVCDTDGEVEALNRLLGTRLVAYHHGDDETMLKFEDGTILQWVGYHNRPLDADEEGLRDIWEERATWVGEVPADD